MSDLRLALRGAVKHPGFTATAVLTLALGIGATTAMFTVVRAVLLRPLPFPRADEIVAVNQRFADGAVTSGVLAPAEIAALRRLASVHAVGGAKRVQTTRLRADGTSAAVSLADVTPGFFEVFGVPPAAGRGFTQASFAPSEPSTVVMSHRIWKGEFGGAPEVIGQTVKFADEELRIVGVAAAGFDLPRGTDFWEPLLVSDVGTGHDFESYLRVRPGVDPSQLAPALDGVARELARALPGPETGRVFQVTPLVASIVGTLGPTVMIVFGATGLLLLLACVNVTNLLLVRAASRRREVAVREALGAGRTQLLQQMLAESAVLAGFGAVAGGGLAYAGLGLLRSLGAAQLPRLDTLAMDRGVFLFMIGVVAAVTIGTGLVPALRFTRTDLQPLLNDARRTGTTPRSHRILHALTIAEVAVAIMLVAATVWLVRSFDNLRRVAPGFTTEGRLLFNLELGRDRHGRPQQSVSRLLASLGDLPGVAVAGAGSAFPTQPDRDAVSPVAVNGQTDPKRFFTARRRTVSRDFFAAMGMTLVSGRTFSATEEESGNVAIVNEAFIRQFASGSDPAAMWISFGFPRPPADQHVSIVGVVNDVRYVSLAADPEPTFYIPQGQVRAFSQWVVVSTSGVSIPAIIPAIRARVKAFDPYVVADVRTASAVVAGTLQRERLGMILMTLFGSIALVLAAVGIHGVTAYVTLQRRFDVATRLALGASRSSIFRLTMMRALRVAGIGSAIGVAGAALSGRAAASLLYQVRTDDLVTLAGSVLAVTLILLAATLVSAAREARVSPVEALRGE